MGGGEAPLKELHPRYNIPRRKLSREIDQVYKTLKDKLRSTTSDSQKISLCEDIWTKPGMSAAFLRVTSHFYNNTNKKCDQITLAFHRFPSPHTGERIAEHTISDWDIPMSKIFCVITDYGSNMVAAFKEQSTEELSTSDNDSDVMEIKNEVENSFDEDDDNSMEDNTTIPNESGRERNKRV